MNPLLKKLPKRIRINHPSMGEAILRESKGNKNYYCWYQAGPFEIKCGVGDSKLEAREKLNRWLSKRNIGKGEIWEVCYKKKRKIGKIWKDDWFIFD